MKWQIINIMQSPAPFDTGYSASANNYASLSPDDLDGLEDEELAEIAGELGCDVPPGAERDELLDLLAEHLAESKQQELDEDDQVAPSDLN